MARSSPLLPLLSSPTLGWQRALSLIFSPSASGQPSPAGRARSFIPSPLSLTRGARRSAPSSTSRSDVNTVSLQLLSRVADCSTLARVDKGEMPSGSFLALPRHLSSPLSPSAHHGHVAARRQLTTAAINNLGALTHARIKTALCQTSFVIQIHARQWKYPRWQENISPPSTSMVGLYIYRPG